MNRLPPDRFREVDDLLAFISIYDDETRTRAFTRLLRSHRHLIAGAVCVEAGCGLGLLSEQMAHLGAQKVYAVEHNPLLADLARRRLAPFPQVTVVQSAIEAFEPKEPVDVLVHEFFGQLLYDEDLFTLERLAFKPRRVLPECGELRCAVLNAGDYVDDVVTSEVLALLKNTLVSGLFEEQQTELPIPVARWQFGVPFAPRHRVDLTGHSGDLLVFGIEIRDGDRLICRSGECPNWSQVWTPRCGDRFEIEFVPADTGRDVLFRWLDAV